MIESPPTVETLTHFRDHTEEWLDRLKATGEPIVFTCPGRGDLVVQDADAYRRMAELAERAEMMEFLNKSLADVEAGRTRPMREAIEALGNTDAVSD